MEESASGGREDLLRRHLRRFWQEVETFPRARQFLNLEGGSVDQGRDGYLRFHHCANYAAVLTVLGERSSGLRILELGCGSGLLSIAFARLMPANWQLVASDYSEPLINYARAMNCLPNLSFLKLNVKKITDRTLEGFDAVIALEVIEHLTQEELRWLLHRLYQGLKDGGTVIVTTLDRSPFKRRFSGYAHHRFEYRYDTLLEFLSQKRNNPFALVKILRIVSPLIARQAVRAENRGGYLLNRLVALLSRTGQRYPALGGIQKGLFGFIFQRFNRLIPHRKINIERCLNSVRLVADELERCNQDSFSLVAVLRKECQTS